ncbi:hypothetical protein LXL04_010918 [Taraxacum kok-saghyz]
MELVLFYCRAFCIALAQKGIFVTAVDFSTERGEELALLSQKENLKFHPQLKSPSSIFVKCNVSNKVGSPELKATFDTIIEAFLFLDKNGDGKLNKKDIIKAMNEDFPMESRLIQ